MKRFLNLCGGVAAVLASVVIAPQFVSASSAVSPFDPTFGTDGMVVTGIPLQKSQSIASDVISDSTGNLYVLYQASGGSTGSVVTIGKLTADGSPITQFGTNGRTAKSNLSGANFALQNDAKLVVAGYSTLNGRANITVQRFNSNGTLDTTFGTAGVYSIPEFPGRGFSSPEVFVSVNDSSERIHLGFGVMNSDSSNANFYFVTLQFSGELDYQWGNSGGREVIPRTGGASAFSSLTAMKILSDGSLLGVGSVYDSGVRHIVLSKLNDNGYLDTTFDGASNGNGIVRLQFGSESDAYMTAATVLQNDDVIIAGLAGTYFYGPWYYGVAKILANGTADTSFGSSGFTLSSLSNSFNEVLPKRIGVQSDGRYVLPINSGTTAGFMRVETNGTFNNSPNCSECLWSGTNSGARASSLLVQSSDKIVLVGDLFSEKNAVIARFVSNGTLDGTFNNDSLQLNFEKWRSYIIGSRQQPDGSIISAGAIYIDNGGSEVPKGAIFKFTSSGELDTSFGLGGFQVLSAPTDQYWMYTVDFVVQPDGKILLIANGWTGGQLQVILMWRVNANGSLDNTFGTNGSTVTSDGSAELLSSSILLTSDGKILLPVTKSVNYQGSLWLYRFTSNGQLDSTFTDVENFAGGIKLNIGDGTGGFHSSTVAPNGFMYITGNTTVNGHTHTFVARLQSNGILDSSFSGGFVSWATQGPNLPDYIRRIVIDSQARLILLGQNYSQNKSSVIARLMSNGTFDSGFNTIGYKNFNFRDPTQIDNNDASDVIISNNKYIILGGGDSDPQQSTSVYFSGLAQMSLNGEFDTSIDSDGILLPFSSTETYFDDAEQLSDGSILISGSVKIDGVFESFFAKLKSTSTTPTTTPPTTTPPTPAPTTTVPPVEVNTDDDIKLVISVSQAAVLKRLKITVPKGGKVSMKSTTTRVCRVAKTKVLATSTGTCRVSVIVTVKKKRTLKTLVLRVT